MRGFAFSALAVTGVIAVCSGCQNNPDAAPVNNAALMKLQMEQYIQQFDKVDEQIERSDEMLDSSDEKNVPYERILPPLEITLDDPFEIILDRSEEIFFDHSEVSPGPFNMILLDKWEKQSPPQQ